MFLWSQFICDTHNQNDVLCFKNVFVSGVLEKNVSVAFYHVKFHFARTGAICRRPGIGNTIVTVQRGLHTSPACVVRHWDYSTKCIAVAGIRMNLPTLVADA